MNCSFDAHLRGAGNLLISVMFVQFLWIGGALADGVFREANLRGSLTSFEDAEGSLTYQEVWSRLQAGRGNPVEVITPDFGLTSSTFWIEVALGKQDLAESKNWTIEIGFPRLRSVHFFAVSKTGELLKSLELGLDVPLDKRAIYARSYVFPFELTSDYESVLVRVQSTVPMQIPISLKTRNATARSLIQRDLAFGIYFGLALMMVLYNLVIYFFTREVVHVIYSAQVLSFVAAIVVSNGFGYYFFPDSFIPFFENAVFMGTVFPAVFFLLFLTHFFDLKRTDPSAAKFCNVMIALAVFRIVIFPFMGVEQRILLSSLVALAVIFALLLVTARQIQKKQSGAKLLFSAWLVFLGGVFVFYCNRLGILPRNVFTEYSMLLGSAIEITLLSLAIPHRLEKLRRERDDIVVNLANVTRELHDETDKREDLTAQVSALTNSIAGTQGDLDALRNELSMSENQLIQAEKMASVGQLVASVTHDIANPTTHILVSQSALTQKIEDILKAQPGSISEEKLEKELNAILRYSEFIRSGASTIADIHRSFAYYSRSDPKMRASVDIEKVLKDAMTILTTRVQPHVLDTVFLECPRIACRPSEICQMVANLVSNAADVLSGIGVGANGADNDSQSGRISLRVSPAQEHGADGISIEIHDSGPGIPEEHRRNIFKPFITTKEAGEGTGLGLAITQRIVERHSGRIEVTDSEEFGGALFRVWVPVQQGDDDYESEPAVQV